MFIIGIGRGKACPGSDSTGKTEIDLTLTPFQIPAWVQFEYQKGNPTIVTGYFINFKMVHLLKRQRIFTLL